MKIGPKYKIARRLGAPIFEKTQNNKYALSAEKKSKTGRFQRSRTDYGLQLTEKQKMRYFYGVTEKQFKNYAKGVLVNEKGSPTNALFSKLESRLDNTVWRIGLAATHSAARQMVAHGHITINGKRVYTPSYEVYPGNIIGIREGSKKSPLFNKEKSENPITIPGWVMFDESKKEAKVERKPKVGDSEVIFDMEKVIEFYQR